MELDQEKLTRNESERSRELSQRIRRELGPCLSLIHISEPTRP